MSVRAIPFPKIEAVTFRTLRADEYEKLKPLLIESKWVLPYPDMSAVVVGEYQDKIVCFTVTQLVPHAEPHWIDPEWRGSGLSELMINEAVRMMENSGLHSWVVVAPTEDAARLCRKQGMKEIPGTIFVKE